MLCGNFIQSILPYKHKEYVTISSCSVEWQQRKKCWGWSATFSVARDRKGFSSLLIIGPSWPALRTSRGPLKLGSFLNWQRRRGRQRERQKSSFAKRKTTFNVQQAFLYIFFCRHCTTTTWNSLTGRFMEVVNTTRPCFLPTFILGFSLQEFNSRKIHLQRTF